ncbi:MAG: hypothetical protein WA485_25060 [Candidatus Sulfotelmatobacter sp.]
MSTEHSQEHQTFVQEESRRVKIESAISRTLDTSKLKHQDDRATAVRAIISKLEASGASFKISDRNWLVATRGSQTLNLQNEVDHILTTDDRIGDPASVQAAVSAGDLTVECRSDLTTPAQKCAFINKHGYPAWEKLPTHRSGPTNMDPATMTKADYNKMSVKQKIAFQKTIDEPTLGAILSRR